MRLRTRPLPTILVRDLPKDDAGVGAVEPAQPTGKRPLAVQARRLTWLLNFCSRSQSWDFTEGGVNLPPPTPRKACL